MVHVMGIYAGGTVYQQCTSRKQDVLTDLFGRLLSFGVRLAASAKSINQSNANLDTL